MEIYQEIEKLREELNKAIDELIKKGSLYASAYRKYRMLLAKELIKLRDGGMPVTIAYDIARGKEEIANAKFEEISTEVIYKANLENINSIKLQLKILQNQYEKEYGRDE